MKYKTKQKPIPPPGSLADVDAAYLAGLIDGEGCIGIYVRKPTGGRLSDYHQLKVVVSMRETESIEFMANATNMFGSKKHHRLISTGVVHECALHGRRAVAFLKEILPYLKVKRLQAETAIEFFDKCSFNSSNQLVTEAMLLHRESYRVKLRQLKRPQAAA